MWTTLTRAPAAIVAAVFFVVVWGFGIAGEYGWFTDELYFVACSRRPALGYVDHPPLATLVLAGVRALTGDTLWVIRIVPALAGAVAVWLSGRLARRLGGTWFAELFAAFLVAAAPAVLVISGFYSMNPFELVIAVALAHLAVEIADGTSPRSWLRFGALVGIGLLNKHTLIITIALFTAGMLSSPVARRQLATRHPWLGLAVALAIFAPHAVWLWQHDWITVDFYRESTALKNVATPPL
nr:glycosyltransferase family 39 protein [Deltaproteobacteria bacterium]